MVIRVTGHTEGASAAHREAERVVGLYGDPDVSWSIVMEAHLARPVDPAAFVLALRRVVAAHPHLGPSPLVSVVPGDAVLAAREAIANGLFTPDQPLVRGAVDEAGTHVVVGCHHGVADGLGLLGLLGAALDLDLRSSALGIAEQESSQSFARRSLARLREAALTPPQRLRRVPASSPARGDWLYSRSVTPPMGTAALVAAARAATDAWNGTRGAGPRRPVVLAIGASRRTDSGRPEPDRQTAYLRLEDVPAGVDLSGARSILRNTEPEPTFPATTGLGIGPMITRALSSRLGSTMLLSNVGDVLGGEGDGGVGLESLAFFPATGGPSAVAVGLVTANGRTELTVRAARRDFSEGAAEALVDHLAQAWVDVARGAAGQ